MHNHAFVRGPYGCLVCQHEREQEQRNKMLTMNAYQSSAMRTRAEYRLQRDQLINAALGLAGESGEFCDVIKKYLHHGHDLGREKLVKELGDILWYVAEACDALDIGMEEVAQRNIEKLRARYPAGFDTERSINKDETKE